MSPRRFLAEHTSWEIQEWQAWHVLEAAGQQMEQGKAEVKEQVHGNRKR